jgi:preprotein translocase subunit SecA
MAGFFKNLFGGGELAAFEERVAEIGALEPEVAALSNDALRAESQALKQRLKDGEEMDAILPRAFALVREAAKRTLGQRPYDVQLMGGLALHSGAVAEMATGEGKTLSAVAPAYLNALNGEGVHVVTVNEYLARRDAVWMGQIYRALGLSVACLVPNSAFLYDPEWQIPKDGEALADQERDATGNFLVQQEFLRPVSRREAYLADVTYGTNHEFGFDLLRDNLAYSMTQQVQRGHAFAIIDEVDSILIDEARTPLIISAPDSESSELYKTFSRIVINLKPEEDYLVDEKLRSVLINDSGIEKVEKMLGIQNMYSAENLRLVHYLEESLKAKALFTKDKEYVVREGQILIVDEFTGRILQGRRYNGGLHQAIEAKEGVEVQQESRTYGKISIQNYFRLYKKISGMTGTAQTSAEEFHKVYNLEAITIPTNRPNVRIDAPDLIYKNAGAKWRAVVAEIKERHEKGQPVLVGTTSITKNELVSEMLSQANIPHQVLNAKRNEEEGKSIAQAGRPGKVTVATNIAGRGVDIILGGNPPDSKEAEKVRELGGLYVLGTERHEARRIDNQLRGRAARQGDPGSSQFFLSLEDDLMRIFGGDRIKGLMDRFDLPEDQPIQMGMVSSAVAQAQAKVEGNNFDVRKHLLEYDDVLNKQRTAVYKRRQEVLAAMSHENLANIIFNAAYAHIEELWSQSMDPRHDFDAAKEESEKFTKMLQAVGIVNEKHPLPQDINSAEDLKDMLVKRCMEAALDPATLQRMLSILDLLWMSHLEDLEALNESVGLRAYAQKDPLVEYREESRKLFDSFWDNFNGWIFSNVFKLSDQTHTHETSGGAVKPIVMSTPIHNSNSGAPAATGDNKIGRNDTCPCGSGLKWKKCGLLNSEEHQKNMAKR